jgi:hypothetical protein
MLLVHLYFVKLFGCQIMEAGIPIDISTFSNAILEGESHPNIYLSFGRLRDVGFKNAGGSDVTVKSLKGKPIAAAWMYHIENMCVKVTYAAEGIKLQNLDRLYNPRLGAKQLLLEDFSD